MPGVDRVLPYLLLHTLLRQEVAESKADHGRERLREEGLLVKQAHVGCPDDAQAGCFLLVAISLPRGRSERGKLFCFRSWNENKR